jgi:hypothetical protein
MERSRKGKWIAICPRSRHGSRLYRAIFFNVIEIIEGKQEADFHGFFV